MCQGKKSMVIQVIRCRFEAPAHPTGQSSLVQWTALGLPQHLSPPVSSLVWDRHKCDRITRNLSTRSAHLSILTSSFDSRDMRWSSVSCLGIGHRDEPRSSHQALQRSSCIPACDNGRRSAIGYRSGLSSFCIVRRCACGFRDAAHELTHSSCGENVIEKRANVHEAKSHQSPPHLPQ
jgi:hypothetical protein